MARSELYPRRTKVWSESFNHLALGQTSPTVASEWEYVYLDSTLTATPSSKRTSSVCCPEDCHTSEDNQALCEAMVVLAHKLGLKVIAEGVETAEQRDFLKAVDCDFAQGFFYSTPVLPHEFERRVWPMSEKRAADAPA